MSDSFSGSISAITKALLAATFEISSASSAIAGDWVRDEDGFPVVTLEQKAEGYLEPEKIAVGCADHVLFFERFSPAGNAPSSLVRFDDGTEMLVEWNKLDAPNTMWAYGQLANSIIARFPANMVSFQEGQRPAVAFHFVYSPDIADCR